MRRKLSFDGNAYLFDLRSANRREALLQSPHTALPEVELNGQAVGSDSLGVGVRADGSHPMRDSRAVERTRNSSRLAGCVATGRLVGREHLLDATGRTDSRGEQQRL